METEEDAIVTGLGRPVKRMLVLLLVTYFAAIFYPVADSLVYLLSGGEYVSPDGSYRISQSIRLVDWGVFPALQFFTMDVVPVYGPVTIFCILASVTDRSEAWRVNVFAGVVTFFAYVIEDLGEDALLMNMALLAVVIAAALLLWAARDVWDLWWGV